MWDDRFEGEAEPLDVMFHCDYCGCRVDQGGGYYEYETLRICDSCARRFAWAEFLQLSKKRSAKPDEWI